MLRGLVNEGVIVQAVVPVPWTERRGAPATTDHGYPVHYVPFWFVPRIAPLALARQLGWSAGPALHRAATRSDVFLGYWADPDGTALAKVARKAGLPMVQMVGGSDVLLLAADPARGQRIVETLHAADKVLTIGAQLQRVLIDQGVPAAKIEVFRRGVDRRRFSPGDQAAARQALGLPPERKVLLWVGRMVPVKGLDILLRAMARDPLAGAAPLLVLVGDGPERPALEREAQRSLPEGAVRFVGSVTHSELVAWYRAADLMVLPSRSEGVPNVLLEALACGTGFVASDVGSVRELASDPTLDLVPPGDPDRLAAALAHRLARDTAVTLEVPDSMESARLLHDVLQRVSGSHT